METGFLQGYNYTSEAIPYSPTTATDHRTPAAKPSPVNMHFGGEQTKGLGLENFYTPAIKTKTKYRMQKMGPSDCFLVLDLSFPPLTLAAPERVMRQG